LLSEGHHKTLTNNSKIGQNVTNNHNDYSNNVAACDLWQLAIIKAVEN